VASGTQWRDAMAPDLAVFQALAGAAWDRLPGQFRQMCGDLVIRIEDFATDEVLDELEIESPFELLGLYQGVALTNKSTSDVPREPDMVFLYRRAILDEWGNGEDSLGEIITHVLVHEIGHHFGFSDGDMDDIENHVLDVT
jgi:predicted Zn-dependent protease with MMP-like domain